MRITVLGAGAWGTALAKTLHENGNAVTLWDLKPAALDDALLVGCGRELRRTRFLVRRGVPRGHQAVR